jgi:hypothetical protein
LDTPASEKGPGADEEGVGPLAPKACEGCVDLSAGFGIEDLDLQPHGASSRFDVCHQGLGQWKGWIDQHGNTSGRGHHLAQQFQPLCRQFTREKIDACQVAPRSGEAGDETNFDRVIADAEDDGDRGGCRLGSQRRRRAACDDHGDPPANQFGRQLGQSTDLIIGPPVFDRDVLTLDIAGILQALTKCAQHEIRERASRLTVEVTNHGHSRLLRARRDWPRDRRAAEQRDEIAPSHSITSSAVASSVGGTVRPSILAVLRLITSSNLSCAWTGSSPAFSPLRMRSTYIAASRKLLCVSNP